MIRTIAMTIVIKMFLLLTKTPSPKMNLYYYTISCCLFLYFSENSKAKVVNTFRQRDGWGLLTFIPATDIMKK